MPWCFSWPVPIPLYTPPVLRSSRNPNPFDQTVPRRSLRVFVDQPLMSGPVDGDGEFRGYAFTGSGSTGYPDVGAVLRSYLGHPAFEVLFAADDLDEEGAVVLGQPQCHPAGRDTLPVQVKTATGTRYTGISYYEEAVREASEMVARYHLDESDARAGVLFYRVGSVLEADLVITGREWLLAERGRSHGRHLASVVSPDESLALMGLYLRWHSQPVIVGGAAVRWPPTAIRRSAAFAAMPAFERWNQAGRVWCDTDGDLTLERLNQTCLTRVSRAFKCRDSIFGLSAMRAYDPEKMLRELDSLVLTLVGAFDVAARIVDRTLGLQSKPNACGWQNTTVSKDGKKDGWQTKLQASAKALYGYTEADSEMQRMFKLLRWLRNSVHNEGLGVMRDERVFVATLPADVQRCLKAFLEEGHSGWTVDSLGVRVQPPGGVTAAKWLPGTGRYSVTLRRAGAPRPEDPLEGQLVLDVRRFINKVFPAALTALNGIMQRTPLKRVPGYTQALEEPTRVNLPWEFSDTTGHRLRMIYGITELA